MYVPFGPIWNSLHYFVNFIVSIYLTLIWYDFESFYFGNTKLPKHPDRNPVYCFTGRILKINQLDNYFLYLNVTDRKKEEKLG